MKLLTIFIAGLFSLSSWAVTLQSVTVNGENRAKISFTFDGKLKKRPKFAVKGNKIHLTFPGTTLASEMEGKWDSRPEHFLIQRVSAVSPVKNTILTQIVVNGSEDKLYERIQVKESGRRVEVGVSVPIGGAGLALMKKEAAPLGAAAVESPQKRSDSNPLIKVGLALGIVLLLGCGVLMAYRMIRKQVPWKGSRKYLIEQVSYCGLGPKQGVALLKVGAEFILVGISPGRVNFLSNMPKLSDQYADESQYERGSFKSAVEEEFSKISSRSQLEA